MCGTVLGSDSVGNIVVKGSLVRMLVGEHKGWEFRAVGCMGDEYILEAAGPGLVKATYDQIESLVEKRTLLQGEPI